MRLVDKQTGREVAVGDTLKDFRGDEWELVEYRDPSDRRMDAGKVVVRRAPAKPLDPQRIFFVGVFGLHWLD